MKKVFLLVVSICFVANVFTQVTPQTGSATFSLPMFNWSDNKSRLNALVSLSYSSGSGLKTNDIASNVGQGWNLVAGGVVSRLVVGLPDDQKPREGNVNAPIEDLSKYPAGYLYDPLSAATGCPGALMRYPVFGDKNHLYKQHNTVAADKELDYFSFQFNGRSGLFVVGKNNGDLCKFIGDSKMRGWFERDESMISQGIRTTISAFFIQDENGLIYKFAKRELTKAMKYGYCDANLVAHQIQPKFEGENVYHETSYEDPAIINPYIINSWYLSEVKDVLTQRLITFNYVVRNIEAKAGNSFSYYYEKNYSVVTHNKSLTQTPTLTGIVFPDGHEVVLNYGGSRADLPGAYALAYVDIKYQSRYISKFELTTSYIISNRYGNAFTPYQKKNARLYLLSVKRTGVDLKAYEKPYEFDYYMGSSAVDDVVPAPFSYAKDIWGYYNGSNTRSYNNAPIAYGKLPSQLTNEDIKGLCFRRENQSSVELNPKSGYAKNGLLKQIKYPTGGAIDYEYEQNTALLNGTAKTVGGVHVSKTKVTDGGYSNDCANPLITNYTYNTALGNSASSLWGYEEPVNHMQVFSHYEPEDKYFYYRPLLTFGCDYRFQFPGIMSRDQAISLTSSQQFMVTLSKVMDIVSGILTVIDIVNVCLSATPAAWIAVIIDIIASLATIAISCLSNLERDETTTVYYNSDMNASNPLPMQFKRVEVTESSGTNGKTVLQFTNPDDDDCPIWELTNPSLSMMQRYAYWTYGLPRFTTILDAQNNKISQTENVYNFSLAKGTHTNCVKCPPPFYSSPSCKCLVKESISQRSSDWSNANLYEPPSTPSLISSNAQMTVKIYDIYTGRTELEATHERIYKSGSQSEYLESSTYYTYDSENYQVSSVRTSQSNGDQNQTYFTYNNNYSAAGALAILRQNNILTAPISKAVGVNKNQTGFKLLHETVTEYGILPNGAIKPQRTLEKRLSVPSGGAGVYPGPGDPANSTNYVQTQNYTYDASSNLTGVRDEGGRLLTSLYDYNDKYVVATVINADPILDKASYTSFENGVLGGWVLSGNSSIINVGVTGKSSFSLTSSNGLSASLNPSKAYRITFWASNSSVSLGGSGTLVKSGPTINGFTYFEYIVAQGGTTISLTGNASIDELRLYPQLARMRTVTFDPLIGKTAECDENNRITYYEYDPLGRLRFIKDATGNIVKMYEYNTVSDKITPCTVTYYNRAISEVFSKDNCGAGFLGGDYNYTIPANKYSSTVSQFAVDQFVESELNTYGQSAANADPNITCKQLFGNSSHSEVFTKQACPIGMRGTTYTYTVPANKYFSTIGVLDADLMAFDEINANGQAEANRPGNAGCVIDTAGVWIGTGGEQCISGHKWMQVMNHNPNSQTYNQTMWVDPGIDASCPQVTTYYNVQMGVNKTRNNCTSCMVGTSVTIWAYANDFSSTISQAHANQLAQNYLDANSQTIANNTGSCNTPINAGINATNTTQESVYITLTNTCTYSTYPYTLGSSTSTSFGPLPSGTYNVYMSSSSSHVFSINGFTSSGSNSANINNVVINGSAYVYIQ